MQAVLAVIRDATWLTPERARAYRTILLVLCAAEAAAIAAFSHHGLDPEGRPVGTDFISFWAASSLALAGHPAQAYDVTAHWAAQNAAFPGAALAYSAFFYPPVFLLACLPLALLPYFPALIAWLTTTGACAWAALRHLSRGQGMALLAFPAVWQNVMHGQNGFLTTALFGAAIACLDTAPIAAGLLLGALIGKPHFMLMLPVALIAAGRWRTLAAAAVSAAALCALSLALFGADTWQAFLADAALARETLEQNFVGNDKMQSAFAAVRLWGGGLPLAYGTQAVLATAVAAVLARVCHNTLNAPAIGAALAGATTLASPFLLVYDLMLLAIPLLWLLRQAAQTRFRPWEKTVMAAAFILPLISAGLAHALSIPLAPFVITALFALVVRRVNSPPSGSP